MNNEPILFVPCNLENTNMNSVQWFFFYRENVAFSQTTKRLGGKYVVVSGLHHNRPSSISCDLAVKKMGSVRWPVRSIVGLWRVEFIFTLTTAHRYRGLSWTQQPYRLHTDRLLGEDVITCARFTTLYNIQLCVPINLTIASCTLKNESTRNS